MAFTGGIGENAGPVRAMTCGPLAWLGLRLDAARNEAGEGERIISEERSPVQAWVIPTDEETAIARHAERLLGANPAA